jgi:hypothetical protein
MNPWKIKENANDFDVPPRIALKMRIRFLYDKLLEYTDYLDGSIEKPDMYYEDIINELIAHTKALAALRKSTGKDDITDEMISRAREHPIDSLIEFIGGKSLAWCHEDKTPSLTHYKKGNIATCFVCNKHFNPIDVLIERDKMSFISAVRYLCK